MLLKRIDHPDATIFHIQGRVDSVSTPELEERVIICLDQGTKNLILDFSELDYINSAGLRVLVMSYQRLVPLGGQVIVCGFARRLESTAGRIGAGCQFIRNIAEKESRKRWMRNACGDNAHPERA